MKFKRERREERKKPVTAVIGRNNEGLELKSAVTFGSKGRQYPSRETVVAAISRQVNLVLAAHQHFDAKNVLLLPSFGRHVIDEAVLNVFFSLLGWRMATNQRGPVSFIYTPVPASCFSYYYYFFEVTEYKIKTIKHLSYKLTFMFFHQITINIY